MAVYQVKIPACTFAGKGSIEKVKDIVEKEQAKTALVFTDQGIKNAGILDCLTEKLDKLGIITVFILFLACDGSFNKSHNV